MHSAIVAAAFAAGALAVPYQKRDVSTVYDYDYVTVTDVVTITAGSEPTSSVAAAANIAATSSSHWGHHWHPWSSEASSAAPTSAPEPETSYAPAPSSYEAPTTSTYVAPTISSYVAPTTSTYVAPTTTAAPISTQASAANTGFTFSSTSYAPMPTDYATNVLNHHNLHRSNHSAANIEWDDKLAWVAARIAGSCYYGHNTDLNKTDIGGYGQNIAAGVEAENVTAIITDLFYNGEFGWFDGQWGKADPDMTNFEKWGHLSQILWKDTTHVGCYTYDCTKRGLDAAGGGVAPFFTVCNYQNPGNYGGEYGDNVGSPMGAATAEWNYGL